MCGIAGLFQKSGTVDESRLKAASRRLSHRGPDSIGSFIDGKIGLAHTRLAIIDQLGGQQPLLSEDGQLALIANGEIYNYPELTADLKSAGRHLTTHSDSECILHSYALDSNGFIEKLRGMFAFAIYDRTRQRLTLARDRLGIKPLYYAVLADRVAFASEIKALLPLLGQAPAINIHALAQYAQNEFITGEETIIQQIKRVLPGEMISIDAKLRISRCIYWSPLHIASRTIQYEDAAEEFSALFRQVMSEHMRSDVPYGLFLSGGLDSASILGMLDKLACGPVKTYSVGYSDVQTYDELADAKRMADRFGADHTELRLDRDGVLSQWVRSIWAADDLMLDYASLPTARLAECAQAGLKVVFTGEGGDEVFAGYGRYRPNPLTRLLKNLRRSGSGGFRTLEAIRTVGSKASWDSKLTKTEGAFRKPIIEAWQRTPESWSFLQRAQYTDMCTALPDNLLVKVDRMLMSFGIEGRVPFLDHRVVEFGLSLPDHLKVSGREGKHFLRRWSESLLPSDYVHRKKRGFGVPLRQWLRGDFLDRLEIKLGNNRAVKEWFNLEALPELFAVQRTNGTALREIICLLQFAIWHRLFVEDSNLTPSSSENLLDWIS
ncbi:asparagine synthase (glutamine-hydrolyzing) [Methyloterricola oryzae]|uniref:asparagine synthase (glutamine-hydrolyzing) n=1 Tax=Methyloterricola oryzae TaxID=1495050 RepID=UPI0005EBB02D|nr:asparagine synthase (glutamine-hydrolyzing) [Methyloterricola oryzae]